MFRRRKRGRSEIEAMLQSHRSTPSPDFVGPLSAEIRGAPQRGRAPWRRSGTAIALAGLIVVAVASFGGVGYGSSKDSQAPSAPSAAQKEYGEFTPPTSTVPKQPETTTTQPSTPPPNEETTTEPETGEGVAGGEASSGGGASSEPSSSLPFTGLALWVPLAGGLLLIGLGLALRARGRRRDSTA